MGIFCMLIPNWHLFLDMSFRLIFEMMCEFASTHMHMIFIVVLKNHLLSKPHFHEKAIYILFNQKWVIYLITQFFHILCSSSVFILQISLLFTIFLFIKIFYDTYTPKLYKYLRCFFFRSDLFIFKCFFFLKFI